MLAMRDRDRANKNEIGILTSSVTSNDFPHAMLLIALTQVHPFRAYNHAAEVTTNILRDLSDADIGAYPHCL